ncbi:exodeoxyribonuclease VII large subunit [Caldicellulosiruptor morganii]|uniref:Exodeoxyribonuclease 7 large subunit n=1 Tax=Caldicellulosiruptor morganii TaxID=1387555 RepID=A0ABY7BPK1_9FIRM|nr:exodeoxyribonuclease VII large subunit [Caldicellulosiruptor morganii]WAM34748.1 exodeoxyribonuclease VII large subunit [Caldicellulosiruptor morganii]
MAKKEWSVYELTSYLRKKVEMDVLLKNIYLKGEVIRPTLSGDHLYFELKDLEYDAKVKCVYFWFDKRIEVRHGSKVLIKGSVIFYEKEGIIEIKVNEITDIGLGELFVKLKQLEEKLRQEGLFDQKHKKEIPQYPKRIGIVTSKNGAAVRDIINTIYSKFENVEVYIFNCSVQGQSAPFEICEGIEYFNKVLPVEVIIVGRGGGAFEDLMAFNDEMVVRKIFESEIPVISAVGHERDYVLTDFVADLRAITPTNAGEIVVGFQNRALEMLDEYQKRMKRAILKKIESDAENLKHKIYRLYQNSPSSKVIKLAQDVNLLSGRLAFSINKKLHSVSTILKILEKRLSDVNPYIRFTRAKNHYEMLCKRLHTAFEDFRKRKEFELQLKLEKLIALNPLNILKRGYSVTIHNSELITSVKQIKVDDEIVTRLSDGFIRSKVLGVQEGVDE